LFINTTDKTIITVMYTENVTRISRITLNRQFCTHTFSPRAHILDTGLEHGTSQIHFTTMQRPMQFRS